MDLNDLLARHAFDRSEDLARKGWYHSIELNDGTVLEGVISLDTLKKRIDAMPIPFDLSGKRALDIGAWDGWFSFELEKRGADVVALDCVELDTFLKARALLGSKVEFREMDVMDLSPASLGYFDIVMFLGVLYHLKHPLLALEKVCELTRDMAIVESHVSDAGARQTGIPTLEYYETDELGLQFDNWFGPTIDCLLAFCRTAGFARVELLEIRDDRAAVACYRKWAGGGTGPAPVQGGSLHYRNYGINFTSWRDDYIDCWFQFDAAELAREDVQPEVGGFGVYPLNVKPVDSGQWVAVFKLPPGLAAGWHDVRVRVHGGAWSNPSRIAVDVPVDAGDLSIVSVCDGQSWTPNEVTSAYASLWIKGCAENVDRNNLRVLMSGQRCDFLHLAAPDENGARQLNVRLPRASGDVVFTVTHGGKTASIACRVEEAR